jgi:hypothetical protein
VEKVYESEKTLRLLFGLLLVFGSSGAFAQTTTDIDLGGGALGRYRTPAGIKSNIAFIAIHRTADYRNHASTTQLQSRGYATLGIRTRFGSSEAAVNWELIALDIRSAVRFLRSQPGITKIVLIGHSGGGPSTSYYQALATHGPSYCQGPNKLTECSFSEADFLPSDRADGMVFVEAHLSNGVNRLRSLNASVVNEDQPFGPARNKTLDPFDPKHGYNPNGDSTYSQHFVDTYARGESRRMNGLINDALEIRQEIELGLRDHPMTRLFSGATARGSRISARVFSAVLSIQPDFCRIVAPSPVQRSSIRFASPTRLTRKRTRARMADRT